MSESQNVELKGAALSRFLLRKQGLHWDGVPVSHARIKELSVAAVDRFREEARRSGRLDGERGTTQETGATTTQETGTTTQETTITTQETAQDRRAATQERILALLRTEPAISRRVMAERIGITPDGVKYHLTKLRAAGVVRHVGATKGGRWEVLK